MKAGPETEAALRELLEHFCVGIATRDGDAVMQLLAPDADVVIVTSGEALLRGRDDVSAFVQRYAHGSTTYTWIWDRRDISAVGTVGWLLAEGLETETSDESEQVHPYRMTMVCERRGDRWFVLQVHGSSPSTGERESP
jgi:ketosteroid isomerase-like protein